MMKYCVSTPNRGWVLQPKKPAGIKGRYDFNKMKKHEFEVGGKSDSNYATCPDTRKSVSGYHTTLEDVPVSARSIMQKILALSVTEAELYSAVQCAQDMLYVKHVIESLGLKVKLPMVLMVDNMATVHLANNLTAAGRTRHVEVRQFFLRELKTEGVLVVRWIAGTKNESDLFTKNLHGPLFTKHTRKFCGEDEYGRSETGSDLKNE